jgi:hypothetical protein
LFSWCLCRSKKIITLPDRCSAECH